MQHFSPTRRVFSFFIRILSENRPNVTKFVCLFVSKHVLFHLSTSKLNVPQNDSKFVLLHLPWDGYTGAWTNPHVTKGGGGGVMYCRGDQGSPLSAGKKWVMMGTGTSVRQERSTHFPKTCRGDVRVWGTAGDISAPQPPDVFSAALHAGISRKSLT